MTISPGQLDGLVQTAYLSLEFTGVSVQSANASLLRLSSVTVNTTGPYGPGAAANEVLTVASVDDTNNSITLAISLNGASDGVMTEYVLGYTPDALLLSTQTPAVVRALLIGSQYSLASSYIGVLSPSLLTAGTSLTFPSNGIFGPPPNPAVRSGNLDGLLNLVYTSADFTNASVASASATPSSISTVDVSATGVPAPGIQSGETLTVVGVSDANNTITLSISVGSAAVQQTTYHVLGYGAQGLLLSTDSASTVAFALSSGNYSSVNGTLGFLSAAPLAAGTSELSYASGSYTPESDVIAANIAGTGYSDILFRNDVSGDMGWWSGPTTSAAGGWTEFGSTSTAYSIVGVGDFNGAGSSDVLFRDNATGNNGYIANLPNGAGSWVSLGGSSTDYLVAGTGDFNGDGTSDIFYLDPTTGNAGFYLLSASGPNTWQGIGQTSLLYSVAGVGNFTGDGKADVLFDNTTNGNTGFYELGIGGLPGTWTNAFNANLAYSVVGIGDFNGDGTSDILYRNNTSGDMGYVAMTNHGTSINWVGLGGSLPAWSVVGVGQYTGNGVADILFRNNTTGEAGYLALGAHGAANVWHEIGQTSLAYSVVSPPVYG